MPHPEKYCCEKSMQMVFSIEAHTQISQGEFEFESGECQMKKSFFAIAAAAALLSVPALAADLPRKAPAYVPPAPPPFTWTGFYAGIHAGWGWSNTDLSVNIAGLGLIDPFTGGGNSDGVVGGFQVGYNWQLAPNWVLGIEGDVSGTGIHNTSIGAITSGGVPLIGFSHLVDRDVKWLASIRGRLGWAADRWLLYITGGGAWAGIETSVATSFGAFFAPASFDKTRSGWVAGGGVEYAFTPNWIGRLEYLHYDLGDFSFVHPSLVAPTVFTTTTLETQINVVRVGVNYKW
jgi:outer membrane immunogenic protein